MANYKWSFDAKTLIPGFGIYRSFKNVFDNFKKNGYQWSDWLGWYGAKQGNPSSIDAEQQIESILGEVSDSSREQYLADREHTEQREDTAYQRAVADMRAAGLNPFTISASPSNSSASSVGDNSVNAKLQMLGYLLDIQNVSINNKKLLNNVLGTIIKAVM